LVEECQKELNCIKDTPYKEYCYAKRSEDPVAPERWWDYGFTPKTLLPADIEGKHRDEDNRK
jgi:hypothetical protein